MIFGSVPIDLRFGSCGSFSFAGSMTPRFVPVRVCRFVSVRGHTVLVVRLGIHLGTPRALCNHWAWVNLLLQHGNGWAPRMTRLQEWDFTCFAIWVPSSSLQTKTKKISASPKNPKKKLGRCELNHFQ